MNGDRRLDIVAARTDAGTVSVFLGDGQGRFAAAADSPFASGSSPEDIALGDFDEDGRLDVAVANHETNHLSLLRGDGRGGLLPPSRLAVPSRPHPHGVAAGDFDGDGHLDLAVESWEENAVFVLRGNGGGVFDQPPTRVAVGRGPYYKLRAGDLDGAGGDDLVTTNTDGSSVSALCADHNGALRPATETATAGVPFAVAIGDVNGDGHPDLAVAHRWGAPEPTLDGLTILIGTGDCVFAAMPESPLRVGRSPTAVAIGDFDGDGVGDIAVANMGSDNVSLLRGDFRGFPSTTASALPVGRAPGAIALADLNGDGKADIVTGNWGSGDVSVVINP